MANQRKTSVEEVQRAAQLLLDELGHWLSREQKWLLRQTVRTGNVVICVDNPVPRPVGWFLVHWLIKFPDFRTFAFPFWMHDLPENSALCDCGNIEGDHYVLLDGVTRRIALKAINRARERVRADRRRRDPSQPWDGL